MLKISQRINTVNFIVNSSSEEGGGNEKGKEVIQQRRHLEEKGNHFSAELERKSKNRNRGKKILTHPKVRLNCKRQLVEHSEVEKKLMEEEKIEETKNQTGEHVRFLKDILEVEAHRKRSLKKVGDAGSCKNQKGCLRA